MPFKKTEDGLNWEPNNDKQKLFLALPSLGPNAIFEALMGGGAGSGKSEILMVYAIVHGWHQQAGFKQLFTRRTYPELSREIIPRSRDMYLPLGAKYFKQDKYWVFPREDQYGSGAEPNGGMIFFGHCENEDDVHNYDGMEINLWTPDELTSYTEFIYTYIGLQRVRSANPDLPAVIRASGMPGDVGHGFVVKRWNLKKYPQGGKVLQDRAGNKRIYIHTTAADNKDGDPNYTSRLESISSEAERRAKKYGDWSTFEGQVFDEFREKRYPGEPDNALHVIEPFDIPKYWPRCVAIDWGYAAMCSVGWGAVSPNRRLYIYRHQTFHREKIENWVPKIRIFSDQDKPSDVVICHSANQHRGEPRTILEQVVDALGMSVRLGEKDRTAGKQLLHEYLRWQPKNPVPPSEVASFDNELAQWIFRTKGDKEYQRYIESFKGGDEETNLPKLLFFKDLQIQLIWDALKQCNYEKPDKDGKRKEDVAEFDGDDPYDMLRMLVHSAEILVSQSIEATQEFEIRDKLEKQLATTQDMTAFYRNMRKLESLNEVKVIRRFSNRRHSYHRH